MTTIAVFNPEHDLCLANGNKHYMPPLSALDFAERGKNLMQYLFDGDTICTTADRVGECAALINDQIEVVPWGWDAVLTEKLRRQGIDETLLQSDQQLNDLRQLQHRGAMKKLQPHNRICCTLDDVKGFLSEYQSIVLKAPWSGSGRGLRWVEGVITGQDESWIRKTMARQGSVIAEPKLDVVMNIGIEFVGEDMHLVGYSLFETTPEGVYRGNLLLTDDEIAERVNAMIGKHMLDSVTQQLREEIIKIVGGRYNGPVGVDAAICNHCGKRVMVRCLEANLRYTMGMVAHGFLLRHPERHGTLFEPMKELH
mgnify:CR=1 FL=1